VVVSLALVTLSISRTVSEELNIKEYEEFHKVLHPLEHEALPKKDFKRIRTNAAELVKRGKAIVELGVPEGTSEANVEEFKKELTKFNDSLDKFLADVKNGSDEQLKTSYSAVHDSFEMLAGMLPRK
jgi:hypothetical protein